MKLKCKMGSLGLGDKVHAAGEVFETDNQTGRYLMDHNLVEKFKEPEVIEPVVETPVAVTEEKSVEVPTDEIKEPEVRPSRRKH